MEFITIFIKDKAEVIKEISLPNDSAFSLMEMLRAAEIPVLGTCGGMALCASCHVYIHSNHSLPDKNEDEIKLLDSLHNCQPNSRLSCQLRMNETLNNIILEIADE